MSSNEDIEHTILDLTELFTAKNHDEIKEFLREKQLDLGDLCKIANGKVVTVYKGILSHVTNGDQLISDLLDQSVQRGGAVDVNSINSYISINFRPLLSSKRTSSQVIRDMINYKSPATRALLTHPVIETFLNIKWNRWKRIFLFQFIVYLLFLVVYSVFLGK